MKIEVEFKQTNTALNVDFKEDNTSLGIDFGSIQYVTKGEAGTYEGEYIVTPKVKQQTMPTKDKTLKDDILVKEIPFFKVSNTSGGDTVYIGNEV